jgi:hypothetical protein
MRHTRCASWIIPRAAQSTGGSVASLSMDRGGGKERKKLAARGVGVGAFLVTGRSPGGFFGSLLLAFSRPAPPRAAEHPRSAMHAHTRNGRGRRHALRRRSGITGERGNGNGMTLRACVTGGVSWGWGSIESVSPMMPWLVGRRGSRDGEMGLRRVSLLDDAAMAAALVAGWINGVRSHATRERDLAAVCNIFFPYD